MQITIMMLTECHSVINVIFQGGGEGEEGFNITIIYHVVQECNGPFFIDVPAFPIFFFIQTKQHLKLTVQFIMSNLENMRGFIRIRCKVMRIWDSKLASFYNEIYIY